jgi:hypothetical protein
MSPQLLRILSVLAGTAVCLAGAYLLKMAPEVAALIFTAGGSLFALPVQVKSMTVPPPPPPPKTEIPPPPVSP